MDAALAALDKFEMFHAVGDIGPGAVDPGLGQSRVEHLSGRSDKWTSGEILLVARLLADKEDWRIERAFAEHGLGGVAVQIAHGAA